MYLNALSTRIYTDRFKHQCRYEERARITSHWLTAVFGKVGSCESPVTKAFLYTFLSLVYSVGGLQFPGLRPLFILRASRGQLIILYRLPRYSKPFQIKSETCLNASRMVFAQTVTLYFEMVSNLLRSCAAKTFHTPRVWFLVRVHHVKAQSSFGGAQFYADRMPN